MDMGGIIAKKRDGLRLTREEINYFVIGYTNEIIPSYQASALLMAICLKGLDMEEIFWLTDSMMKSGDVVDLSGISGIKVDKHSTGGVGDKTTLVAAPLAAACGVPIAKMSGRGLGFTGGTVDKMESIPGFRTSLSPEEFISQVNNMGIAVIGQTAMVAPADKKLYALRDVTATVENKGLIASSIMSKKLASGSDAIVLDVKCGTGAFMESLSEAEELAILMNHIGKKAGKRMVAIITDMSQPLGKAVGNSIEVIEAIETLKGEGPSDITELSIELAGIMIFVAGKAASIEEAKYKAGRAIADGTGLFKMGQFIHCQGGDPSVINNFHLFPKHSISQDICSSSSGYINSIDAKTIGLASQHAGAGRITKEDRIDLSAGIYLHKKRGDKVRSGECLATVYGNDIDKVRKAAEEGEKAYLIGSQEKEGERLIKKIIGL